jgi:hypothetical protein
VNVIAHHVANFLKASRLLKQIPIRHFGATRFFSMRAKLPN